MTLARARAANGFTLLEMLVVLAVMGLVAGLVFPAIGQGLAGAEFRTATAGLELEIRRARAEAIGGGRTVPLAVETGGELLRRAPGGPFRVPRTMQLQLPQSGLRFFRDGTSTGGDVVLVDGRRSFRLHVDADSGAIGIVR